VGCGVGVLEGKVDGTGVADAIVCLTSVVAWSQALKAMFATTINPQMALRTPIDDFMQAYLSNPYDLDMHLLNYSRLHVSIKLL
jgi:hypothetical protein